MKSVLQAGWLLTVAFGNVIVLIVAEGAGLEQVQLYTDGKTPINYKTFWNGKQTRINKRDRRLKYKNTVNTFTSLIVASSRADRSFCSYIIILYLIHTHTVKVNFV